MVARTGRLPSYLTTNGYSYCFRMRVPHDLKRCIGKDTLKFSLGTEIMLLARSKAMIMAGRYQQLFRWVRFQNSMGKMTDQEIQDVVDCFVEFAGDADLWDGFENTSKSLNPEGLRDKIFQAKDMADQYKYAAETGDFSQTIKVENLVDHILEHTVENPPAKGSSDCSLSCH